MMERTDRAAQFIELMRALEDIDRKSEADLSRVAEDGVTRQGGGRPAELVREAERVARAAKLLQERLITVAQSAASRAQGEVTARVRRIETAVEQAAGENRPGARADLAAVREVRALLEAAPDLLTASYAKLLAAQDVQRFLTSQYTYYLKEREIPLQVASIEQADAFLRAAGYPDFIRALLSAVEGASPEETRALAATVVRGYPANLQISAALRASTEQAQQRLLAFEALRKDSEEVERTARDLQSMLRVLSTPGHPQYPEMMREMARRYPASDRAQQSAFAVRPRITPTSSDFLTRRVPPEYRIPLQGAAQLKRLGFAEDTRKCFTADGLPIALLAGGGSVVVEPVQPSTPAHALITVWVANPLFRLLYDVEFVERAELGFDAYSGQADRRPASAEQMRSALIMRSRKALRQAADGDMENAAVFVRAALSAISPGELRAVLDQVNEAYATEADRGLPEREDFVNTRGELDASAYHDALYEYAVELWGIDLEKEQALAGGEAIQQEWLRLLQAGTVTRKNPAVRASERLARLDLWNGDLTQLEDDVIVLRDITRGRQQGALLDYTEQELAERERDIAPVFRHLLKSLPTTEVPAGLEALESHFRAQSAEAKARMWVVFQPQFYQMLSPAKLAEVTGKLRLLPAGPSGEDSSYRMPTSPRGRMQMALAKALQCARGHNEADKGGHRVVLVPSLALYLMRRLESLYSERRLGALAIDAFMEERPGEVELRDTLLEQASDLLATLVAALNELTYPLGEEFADPRDEDNTLRGKGCPALVFPGGASDPWIRVFDVDKLPEISARERPDWTGAERRGAYREEGDRPQETPRNVRRGTGGMLPDTVRERLR